MRKTNNWFVKTLGFTAVFVSMSMVSFAQNSTMPGSNNQDQNNTSQTAPSNQNTSAGQNGSFESYAAQLANDLAQQTGLSSDKADDIRKILVDYYNNITDTRQAFMRDRRDSRSEDADNSVIGRNNTGGNQDVTGSGRTGSNTGTGSSGNTGSTGGAGTTGSTNTSINNGSSDNIGSSGNTGTTGSTQTGSGTTGSGGTGTGITGTTGSTGSSGNNQASSNLDLMQEYRKADIKADEKILDVFDNDQQKTKYVQIKRQWWQNVKDRVFSSANQNYDNQDTGGLRSR